jgi:hypothetical protein
MKVWCDSNPDKVASRGAKIRGKNHYAWRGDANRLNLAIRRLNEHRKWMDRVKERDSRCIKCGSKDNLESHHLISLAEIVRRERITTVEQARRCAALWDISNGITFCIYCHYDKHGRRMRRRKTEGVMWLNPSHPVRRQHDNQRKGIQQVAI